MIALVLAPVSLSWPLFLVACLFTLFALSVVAKDGNKRLVGALLLACILATPAILRAEDVIIGNGICDRMPWLVECWCPICF